MCWNLLPSFISISLVVLLVGGCRAPSLPVPTSAQPRMVVVDTDMAPDDWMAILYLLHRPEVTIKAITVTGAGETHCDAGVRHALGLVALEGAGRIPVACGRATPLQGSHVFPNPWREGVDNLFGLTLPEVQNPVSPVSAVDLLASVIRSSPYKITVLTLGPLTNVAEALQKNPDLLSHIERIYVMGGAVNVPGNIAVAGVGIDNQVAEWNLYVDPHAANIVFASGVPVTLIPLDATNQAPVTVEFYKKLEAKHATPGSTFLFELFAKNHWLFETGKIYFWDPLAAAILTDESLARYQSMHLCVVAEEGPASGWSKPGELCPAIRVAVAADGKRFEQAFLDTLNTPLP